MKAATIFATVLRQKRRDPLGLALTLLTAPLFVICYWLFFADAPETYEVVVHDADSDLEAVSPQPDLTLGRTLVVALTEATSSGGAPIFSVKVVGSRAELERALRSEADVGLIIPAGFSRRLYRERGAPAEVELLGDATRQGFRVASSLVKGAVETFGLEVRRSSPAIKAIVERGVASRSTFELYVPGLLVFTVIMMVFSASMSVVREVEAGTLARLRLAPVSTLTLLAGISAAQFLLGAIAVALTLVTASVLGFRSQGSIALATLVASVASLASVGIGMVVASVSRTVTRAFLVSSVAMFLLVLFSGVVFPQPRVSLFTVWGRGISLLDILPTTHLHVALGKVLNLNASLLEVGYELGWLAAISILNFVAGGIFFARSARPSAHAWEGMP